MYCRTWAQVLLFFCLGTNGCTDIPSPEPTLIPALLTDFMGSECLPKPQPIQIVLSDRQKNIYVFRIYYGEPRGCEAGCTYSLACGIMNDDRLGWLSVKDFDEVDLTRLRFYNPDSTDLDLMNATFWEALNEADSWAYRYALLPMLARDTDTPDEVLGNIARGLYIYIQPSLGLQMLDNSRVKSNSTILVLLANLPIFQGDPYQEVRDKATLFLDQLDVPSFESILRKPR